MSGAMKDQPAAGAHRVLLVDDNVAIHRDYEKVLVHDGALETAELDALEASLFDEDIVVAPDPHTSVVYQLVHAHQGEEAVRLVEQTARAGEEAFAVAFVDVRMPPGIDGIETIRRIWAIDPRIEVVICSAYSDYTRDQVFAHVGREDQVLFLSKPFDPSEVEELALALTNKYAAKRREEPSQLRP